MIDHLSNRYQINTSLDNHFIPTMNRSSNSSRVLPTFLSSRPRWQTIAECTSLSLIDGLAFIGNVLVLMAVIRNAHLRRIPTNVFIVSLALTDIIMSTTCMPVSILVLIQGRWSLTTTLCQIHGFLFFVLAFVSLQTVALVALNRYVSVAKPGVYRSIFTYQRSIVMIISIWVVCILYVTIFMSLNQELFVFDAGKVICHIQLDQRPYRLAWNTITGLLFALVPMATVFMCYFKLFRAIRHHNLMTIRSIRRPCTLASNTEEIRVTKVIVAIMIGFSCCWMPSFAIAYLRLIIPDIVHARTPHLIYIYLVYSSSMINPFIYGILNSTFRGEFLKVILCGRSKVPNADTEALN